MTSRTVEVPTDDGTTAPVPQAASAPQAAPAPDGTPEQHPPRRWWALAVIGLAQLMVVLDATIVNIALPSAQHDLGFDNNGRQWIITAYSLAFGSLLLLGGRLADLIGRRRTFIAGLIGFAGASALGGAADSFTMLVIARALQGLFGAVLAPSAMSLLTTTFTDQKERSKAFGVFGAIAGSGGAIGLLLGGVLTEHLNWRWTLYVNDAIAVLGVLGALAFIRSSVPARRPKLDLLGTLLVAAGLFGVVYGFSNAETHSWGNWMCWAFLAAGGVLLVLFVVWEAHAKNPLLPLRVLADRNRAGSYLSVFVSGTGMFGVFLFLTYYLQTTLDYTPVKTGIAFLPMVGMLMATAQLGINFLIPRFGPKPVVPVGMATAAAALVLFTRLDAHSSYAAHVLPPLLVMGFGLGLVMPPAMSLATLGVDRQDQGVAAAMVNTMQQVGGSVGTALFNTVAATAATHYVRDHIGMPQLAVHAALHSYSTAYWTASVFFVAGMLITVLVYRKGRPYAFASAEKSASGGESASAESAAAPAAAEPLPTRVPPHHHAKGAHPAPDGPAFGTGANGAGPATATVPPSAGESATRVHGHVLNTAGAPLPGAAITLIDPAGRQLARDQAAANGDYALLSPGPGTYVLVASAAGHQPQVSTVQVGTAPAAFDLMLAGSGGLSGTVRSGTAPLAGALIVATDARGDVVGTTLSGDEGAYQLPGLAPGGYTLAISAPGHQPSALPVTLGDTAPVTQDIGLQPAAIVSGTVRDAQGAPLRDARVTLLDPAGNVLSTGSSGDDGGYAFTDLAEGFYTVVASGYPARTTTLTIRQDGTAPTADIELRHEN